MSYLLLFLIIETELESFPPSYGFSSDLDLGLDNYGCYKELD